MNLSKSLRRELENLTLNAEVKSDNTRNEIQIEVTNRNSDNRLKCVVEAKPFDKSPEKVIHDQLIPKYLSKTTALPESFSCFGFAESPSCAKHALIGLL